LIASEPFVKVLFERHQFTHASTIQTARILSAFALGLPAYVLVKIFSTSFFARQDTKTPLVAATLAVITNIVFNFALITHYEHIGIALATSIATWVNAGWLIYQLQKQRYFVPDSRLRNMIPRIMTSTAVMGLTLEGVIQLLQPWLNSGEAIRAFALLCIVFAGMSVYFFASVLLGSLNVNDLRQYLIRKSPSPT
jgi:putative peptidoglycan lipid II flippase